MSAYVLVYTCFLCVASVVRYQEELPALISSRLDKHVTLSELVKLMEWKLTVSKSLFTKSQLSQKD